MPTVIRKRLFPAARLRIASEHGRQGPFPRHRDRHPGPRRRLGCAGGDEYIYLNGENFASIRGTGTEDYFNGGFYFSGGVVSLPFNGLSYKTDSYPLWMSAYRLSIPDAVVFHNALIVDIEHGGVNDGNGNYYSTALFYRDDGSGNPPADRSIRADRGVASQRRLRDRFRRV